MRTPALTALALLAFAGNSLLCREALGQESIDPVLFSVVRLVSGALVLSLLVRLRRAAPLKRHGSWGSATALFLYALPFSLAYVSLEAGSGALILFGAVQLTMLTYAIRSGERLAPLQWCGFAVALLGLVYLMLPGSAAPALFGSLSMIVAGVAWGIYSLLGRASSDPLDETAGNFLRTLPLALLTAIVAHRTLEADPRGVMLAVISGALTSGVGYALWYAALPRLAASSAAVLQLCVPLLAAVGGVLLLAEPITPRLAIASVAILGGVRLSLMTRAR
jgi:drug/metabolite transporter (DMT)-like permease